MASLFEILSKAPSCDNARICVFVLQQEDQFDSMLCLNIGPLKGPVIDQLCLEFAKFEVLAKKMPFDLFIICKANFFNDLYETVTNYILTNDEFQKMSFFGKAMIYINLNDLRDHNYND